MSESLLGEISVRAATAKDVVDSFNIATQVFGTGYWQLDSSHLFSANYLCLLAVETATEQIVGLIEFRRYEPGTKIPALHPLVTLTQATVILETILVSPGHRRYGIATYLYHQGIQHLQARYPDVSTLYTTAWKESPGNGILRLLEKLAWEHITELPNYWWDDSYDRNYRCIRCGQPCVCTAVLMRQQLSQAVLE